MVNGASNPGFRSDLSGCDVVTDEPDYGAAVVDEDGGVWVRERRPSHLDRDFEWVSVKSPNTTGGEKASWWWLQEYMAPIMSVSNGNILHPWPVGHLVVATRKSDGLRTLWVRMDRSGYSYAKYNASDDRVTYGQDALLDPVTVRLVPDDMYDAAMWDSLRPSRDAMYGPHDLDESVRELDAGMTW